MISIFQGSPNKCQRKASQGDVQKAGQFDSYGNQRNQKGPRAANNFKIYISTGIDSLFIYRLV